MVECDVHENDLAEEKESSVRPHNHGMKSSQPEKIYSGVKNWLLHAGVILYKKEK